MGICVNCKSMTIPCTESIEGLSHDNKPGKKSSSSTASNNQDSIQEPPFTIDQKTCLNSGAEMNSPLTNLDRLMLDEINLARRDPKEYSKKNQKSSSFNQSESIK